MIYRAPIVVFWNALRIALALFVLGISWSMPVSAQAGSFVCHDDTGSLDCATLEQAAEPLRAAGARVAVYLAEKGDETGDDVLRRLAADGLANGNQVDPALVAVYVSLDPRYAELRAGDTWLAALPDAELTRIRTDTLTPALRQGQFTEGFAATLVALGQRIRAPSPDEPQATPTPISLWWLLVLSIAAALGIGGGGYALWLWRRDRRALGDARWYTDDLRSKAEQALSHTQGRLAAEQERAASDADDWLPEQAERVAAQRQAAAEQLAEAQSAFEQANQARAAAESQRAELERLAGVYRQISATAASIDEQLAALADERAALAEQAEQARQAAKALPDGLHEAEAYLSSLGIGVDGAQALGPLAAQIDALPGILDEHRVAEALQRVAALRSQLEQAKQNGNAIVALNRELAGVRAETAMLENLGYLTTASGAAIKQAEQACSLATQQLQQGADPAAQLEEGRQALATAIKTGRGQLEEGSIQQQLLQIGLQAGTVTHLLEQARAAFDLVDEFAQSTWQDIRGNGSEAERLTTQAGQAWDAVLDDIRGGRSNSQHGAALTQAAANLSRAEILAQAIVDRLRDLEHARAIARDELAAAKADIETGKAFVQAHDEAVGAKPAAQLERAANYLRRAEQEAAKERPDWLQLVRQAQAANAEADEALLGARSEVESMQALERQAASGEQVARAEIARAQRYFDLHRSDISWSTTGHLGKAREHLLAGVNLVAKANKQSDDLRRASLRKAIDLFRRADSAADQAFSNMYADVARITSQRADEQSQTSNWSWSSDSSSSSSSSSWGSSSGGSSWGSGGSSGGSSWGSGGSSGGSSWGSGSSSGGGW